MAGQVRGIAQMIEDGRYCIDILTLLQAVKSGLARVEIEVLLDPAASFVAQAFASGLVSYQRPNFHSLFALFYRLRTYGCYPTVSGFPVVEFLFLRSSFFLLPPF